MRMCIGTVAFCRKIRQWGAKNMRYLATLTHHPYIKHSPSSPSLRNTKELTVAQNVILQQTKFQRSLNTGIWSTTSGIKRYKSKSHQQSKHWQPLYNHGCQVEYAEPLQTSFLGYCRIFVALFDYDPPTMSPNPEVREWAIIYFYDPGPSIAVMLAH